VVTKIILFLRISPVNRLSAVDTKLEKSIVIPSNEDGFSNEMLAINQDVFSQPLSKEFGAIYEEKDQEVSIETAKTPVNIQIQGYEMSSLAGLDQRLL